MSYEIYKNEELVNTIVADEEFVTGYCAKHGYTFVLVPDDPEPDEPVEPEPTLEERVATLEESNAEMTEALDLILSGVTE